MNELSISTMSGRDVYRRLIAYAAPYWPIMLLAVVSMVIAAAAQAGFVAFIEYLLDEAFVAKDERAIQIAPLLVIGLFLVKGLSTFSSVACMQSVGRNVIKQLRGEVFCHFLRLPVAFYDRQSSGKLVSLMTYNIEQVAESVTQVFTILVRDSLLAMFLIAYLVYLNWMLFSFIVIVGPPLSLIIRYVSRRFRRFSQRIQASMGDVTHRAEEVVQGQRVIKIFGAEEYEDKRFESVNENNRRLHMKLITTKAASTPVVEQLASFGIAGIIYFATHDFGQVPISPTEFITFLGAMLLLMPPLKHLTEVNEPLQKGIAAGASIFGLLDEEIEQDQGSREVGRLRGDVEFRDVAFAYNQEKGRVLDAINFRVTAGQTIALVGRSGSGKSTLVGLIPRFYDVGQGQILVDDLPINELHLGELRSQIALVSQDIVLFNDTIANNIAYGAMNAAPREKIEAAARAAHADQFIASLPEGLDTQVGDRGVLLSGGQRQRIAIARAILKDAPILVLDEATSALDTESERAIQAGLETLMQGRTTFVIAHRLSTVENADCILVLDHGKIVETGTHAELLEKDGIYSMLYKMQFEEV